MKQSCDQLRKKKLIIIFNEKKTTRKQTNQSTKHKMHKTNDKPNLITKQNKMRIKQKYIYYLELSYKATRI